MHLFLRRLHLVPGSDFGSGSLPHPPRLGALPAVSRHPVRPLALLTAIVRAGTAGGAAGAPLEALCSARRHRRQA